MKTHNISKLPQWAQLHIQQLQTKLQRLENDMAALHGNVTTNTYFKSDSLRSPLPNNTTIQFILPTNTLTCSINLNNELKIYGNNQIKIIPQAANSIAIY